MSGQSPDFGGHSPIGVGGTGVSLGDASRLTNTGLIEGGNGGYGPLVANGVNETGGVGVALGGAAILVNSGTIAGGTGGRVNFGNLFVTAAAGGAGVVIEASGTVINKGHITAGNAGGVYNSYGSRGGVGVDVGAGTLNNTGTITGGVGDPGSFEGAYFAPGGAGVTLSGGHVVNAGTIVGGAGYRDSFSSGGAGLSMSSGAVTNTGLIVGGVAGGNSSSSDVGGAGVTFGGGTLYNAGTIAGGAGSSGFGLDMGGAGLVLESFIALSDGGGPSNAGTIVGGAGGSNVGASQVGGTGGAAAAIAGGRLTNTGLIQGGQGGAGLAGSGKTGIAAGGQGGVGVYLSQGTLITSGTISGGQGGASKAGNGDSGDAVQFGASAGTLVVDPGAVFHGAVVADSAAADTLVLAGTAAGTLTGLGSTVTGFTKIAEDAQAHWTLVGSVSGTGALAIGSGATLTVTGPVSIATIAFASGSDTLALGTPGHVNSTIDGFGTGDVLDLQNLAATSLSYGHGTLTLTDAGHVVDALAISGNLVSADFGLRSDGYGGTDVVGQNAYQESVTPASTLGISGHVSPVPGWNLLDRMVLGAQLH